MDEKKLYQSLFNAYATAFPDKSQPLLSTEAVEIREEIKDKTVLPVKVDNVLKQLPDVDTMEKGNLDKFDASEILTFVPQEVSPMISLASSSSQNKYTSSETSANSNIRPVIIPTIIIESHSGSESEDLMEWYLGKKQKKLELEKKKKEELELKLKRKKKDKSKNARDEKKRKLNTLFEKEFEWNSQTIEDDQPLLIKTILDISMYSSALHEKNQNNVYRSITTLKELTKRLKKEGYNLCHSGEYLKLLPKASSSLKIQRNISTVPVKLIRTHNDIYVEHIDEQFCTATIKHLEEVASLLGPTEVCFLSQDDKSCVTINLTAASNQSPLLMHMEYRNTIADHDWVMAARHKLIPSFYAGIKIEKNCIGNREVVGYFGPTYIAIRSGKHSFPTALSHALNFERLFNLKEFDSITRNSLDHMVKPVLVLTVDGSPDENSRNQEFINVAIHHFKLHNLDAIFIANSAPGRNAFNRVERRLASLSNKLSGVILPPNYYCSHLNEKGETINADLEKKNFEIIGKTLANIWSQISLDKFSTVAEYVEPYNSQLVIDKPIIDDKWYNIHVNSSHYFTQIVKCNDKNCCTEPRSSYFNVVQSRFIPPPVPIAQESTLTQHEQNYPSLFIIQSLKLIEDLEQESTNPKPVPYDLYNPSVANAEYGESFDCQGTDILDLNKISTPIDKERNVLGFPVISMKDYFASPWENLMDEPSTN